MAKISRPIVYIGLGAVVVAAWVMTGEGPKAKPGAKKALSPRATKGAATAFTEEDLKARFAALNESPKNAFMPLVARRTSGGALPPAANAVPAELAGGDANWVYTGTAIVDDVPTALLENRVTFDGEFVKQGQRWKHAVVERITPDTITLAGRNGKEYVLKLVDPFVEEIEPGNGFRPLNPALTGPIGTMSIQPEGSGRRAQRGQNLETSHAN